MQSFRSILQIFNLALFLVAVIGLAYAFYHFLNIGFAPIDPDVMAMGPETLNFQWQAAWLVLTTIAPPYIALGVAALAGLFALDLNSAMGNLS